MSVRALRGQAIAFLKAQVAYTGDDCVLWPFSHNGTGYGHVKYGGKIRYTHRVMCELAHGVAPTPEHEAAHSCGKRPCINPKHLSWKTPSGNQADSIIHGTHYHPPPTGRCKLDCAKASEIKAFRGKLTLAELATIYGVTPQTIWKIHNGEIWKHV